MATLSFRTSMSILLFFVIFQVVSGVNRYVHHSCSSNGTFRPNYPFENALEKLLTHLSSETPRKGYTYGTVFTNRTDVIVFGHALCRGDVSREVCKRCVMKARNDIRILCPCDKTAIIWYGKCLLRYSNIDFYGEVDSENKLIVITNEEECQTEYFNEKRSVLLDELANEASENQKRFAKGNSELDESTTLYGLAQCTSDISSSECRRCLDYPIKQLARRIGEKSGGYFISASCIFRYGTHPF